MLFAWAQDESEGAYAPITWLSAIIEGIRCARYTGQTSFDVSGYSKLKKETIEDNTVSVIGNNFTRIVANLEDDSKNSININKIEIDGSSIYIGDKGSALELTLYGKNLREDSESANWLKDYIDCSKSEYETSVEELLTELDNASNIDVRIKKVPDCWFDEFHIERRVNYIDKLAANPDQNFNYIIKLINTFSANDNSVSDFFSALNIKDNIGKAVCEKSQWTNKTGYKKLIETLTMLYYKSLLKDAAYDQLTKSHLFKWHKSQNYNVNYSNIYSSENTIEFSVELDYLVNHRNEREIIEYEPATKIGPFSVVGVDFTTGVDFVGVEGYVFPMPAFYFNWMIDEYDRIELQKAINVTMFAASFYFGVGEIAAATKAWKIAVAIAGIVHSSGKLYFQLNDKVVENLQISPTGRGFLFAWNSIGTILDAANIRDKLVINGHFPLFVSLTIAWDNLSENEKRTLEELLSTEDYNHLINIINSCKQ